MRLRHERHDFRIVRSKVQRRSELANRRIGHIILDQPDSAHLVGLSMADIGFEDLFDFLSRGNIVADSDEHARQSNLNVVGFVAGLPTRKNRFEIGNRHLPVTGVEDQTRSHRMEKQRIFAICNHRFNFCQRSFRAVQVAKKSHQKDLLTSSTVALGFGDPLTDVAFRRSHVPFRDIPLDERRPIGGVVGEPVDQSFELSQGSFVVPELRKDLKLELLISLDFRVVREKDLDLLKCAGEISVAQLAVDDDLRRQMARFELGADKLCLIGSRSACGRVTFFERVLIGQHCCHSAGSRRIGIKLDRAQPMTSRFGPVVGADSKFGEFNARLGIGRILFDQQEVL